jgi:hypothetical protein
MNFQRELILKKFIGPSILILIGSYMLNLSWLKWPDLLVDYGRELYVPWQITQGKVLYTDINHLYGPLSCYFNAFLFQIFGTGISTLAYFNIVIVIFITLFIYTFIKSSYGDLIATLAGVCFLVIFAFSQYTGIANYNFVCPYSHEITYGIFLFFVTLFIFRKYTADPKIIYASLIGFLLGLIFLTKVEIFVAGFISALFGLITVFWLMPPPHPKKHLFFIIFFFLLPVLAFVVYFSFHMPLADALGSVMASYKNVFIGELAGNIYYRRLAGFDEPFQNIGLMIISTVVYLIYFIFAGFVAYVFTRLTKRKPLYGAFILVAAALIMILTASIFTISWIDMARPYPVFIFLFLACLIFNLMMKRKDKTFIVQNLPFILLVIFSLFLLLKMILNVHFYHYGFALAMPAALVMVILMLYYIPDFISRHGNKIVVICFSGFFILLTLLFYFNYTGNVYERKTYPVASGPDRLLTFSEKMFSYGPVINKTLAYIDQSMTPNDTFIVMPDGIMLNYLSRKNNPSRYFEFTPNIVEAIGEENIIHEISMNPPSFIILSKKDTSEHGARFFGADYALNIYSWITDNYDKVFTEGDGTLTGDDCGMTVYKRKR